MEKIKLNLDPADVLPRFLRFSANWGVPVSVDTLKMFLACATDTALWSADQEELPDDQWNQLVTDAVKMLDQK